MSSLLKEGAALKFNASAFDNFKMLLDKEYEPVGADAMADVRKNFLDDYITEKPGKATVVTLVKAIPEKERKCIRLLKRRAMLRCSTNNTLPTVLWRSSMPISPASL